jgi:hypothetical protein
MPPGDPTAKKTTQGWEGGKWLSKSERAENQRSRRRETHENEKEREREKQRTRLDSRWGKLQACKAR